MTVKELIEKLKKLPKEEKVLLWGSVYEDGEGWINVGDKEIHIKK